MKNLFLLILFVLSLNICEGNVLEVNSLESTAPQEDKKAINQLIENYKTSINDADTTLAKTFWLISDKTSFINPKGHIQGWNGIKNGIYKMFGERFSKRNLKTYNETINVFGNMAVVEFYWVFDATFSGDNPKNIQTKGRETQVLTKVGSEWKLVHVHYSNMPVTGEREGF